MSPSPEGTTTIQRIGPSSRAAVKVPDQNSSTLVDSIKWVIIAFLLSVGSVYIFHSMATLISSKEDPLLPFEVDTSEGVVTLVSIVQLDHLTSEFGIKSPEVKSQKPEKDQDSSDSQLSLATLNLNLPPVDKERLKRAALILRQRLILRLFLDEHGLLEYAQKFNSLGVNSLEDAYWFEDSVKLEESLGGKIVPMWAIARESLPSGLAELENLKGRLWSKILALDQQSIWNTWGSMILVTLSVTGFGVVASYFPQVVDAKQAILQYVTGKFSLANNCTCKFNWEDPGIVGDTVSFSIRFFQRGGRPLAICQEDSILIEVKKDSQKVAVVTEFGGKDPSDANLIVVKFSVRKSGQYGIHVLVENNHIRGSPFTRTFLPGKIDPQKTLFLKQTSTVVCVVGQSTRLVIQPKDSWNNSCRMQDFSLDLFRFTAEKVDMDSMDIQSYRNCSVQFSHDTGGQSGQSGLVTAPTSTSKTEPNVPVSFFSKGNPSSSSVTETGRISLQLRFPEPGVFHGLLTYSNLPVQNGKFEIVVLNSNEATNVQKNVVAKSTSTLYEGRLLTLGSEVQNKVRKVYLSVTSKQLVVKEYFWKLLPMRLATFRLSPNTKLQFLMANNQNGFPAILIDDGSQPSITVSLKDAKVVVATFTHFLLRNIGGSETFQDKQEHFYKELRDFHRKHPRDKLSLKIARDNIIENTWKATKGLSAHDFCRNFEINFVGEQGIDWGGLRREWFEQVCSRLFEGGNPVGMFHTLGDSRLVHPNPNSRWKPKHYEMAGRIVGKCLYESSLGSAYRQMVKAKFSRSFLAQLIGLRVSYKYFEQDDPELYLRKIKFILENDVDGMELTFSEEEYDPCGKLIKTVDLIPEGSKTPVTNENKREYLNALAHYRLALKVKVQVDAFLKGLNEVVPDELLSIFDENELELLMCGTSEYSVTELREHHVVSGGSSEFRKILDWFWSAVSNMTEEEKARLLQFTTGCSQLPPGGFKELSPLFQITPSPTFGILPTAHTCFSQLCLPDYENYESFEKCLRIAINEGSEGFGLI